jgi:hypothetical protein
MKNIQFTSQATDTKVLVVLGAVLSGLLVSVLVIALPIPFLFLPVTVFVWGILGLIQPRRPSHAWMIAKWVCIPIISLALTLVLIIWLYHLSAFPQHQLEESTLSPFRSR